MSVQKNSCKEVIKAAFPLTIPVMAGYLFLGMGFGILLQEKGYSAWWAILISVFIYAGSMQYVAVGLLSGGSSILAAALMTLMVNARHLFYGISMIEKYKQTGWKKPLLIHTLTDETYSVVVTKNAPQGVDPGWFYLTISLLNQIYWIIGSAVGGLLGEWLPFDSTGIDFAMTALFLIIFVDQWRESKNHVAAILGVGISVVSLLVFGADKFVIPAIVVMVLALSLLRKKLEKEVLTEDGTV